MNGRKISCLIMYSTTAMDTHTKVWWPWTALIQCKRHNFFGDQLTYNVSAACTKHDTPLRGNRLFCIVTYLLNWWKDFELDTQELSDYIIAKKEYKYPKDWWLKLQTCTGLSRDSKIWFSETLSQLILNPAPRGSDGQNPRHRNVGGSCV